MEKREVLEFDLKHREWLDEYLPKLCPEYDTSATVSAVRGPYVTLTYATSLDSALAISPGRQTALSGPLSKAQTHYLRSRHDAILIGVHTAIVDDPSLNCRLEGAGGGYGGEGLVGQPQPVVLDPTCRWAVEESKVLDLAGRGRGRPPIVVCTGVPPHARKAALEAVGGCYVRLVTMSWTSILGSLLDKGLRSVMIEGGARVINDLLSATLQDSLVDSVIVTIAPTWLGRDGVKVEPCRSDAGAGTVPVCRLKHVKWKQLGDDVVLCGHLS